ncbi:sulfotransferase domain-containing protein [Panacibacter ginsenosidivorans]|uniref:Sulfotransferase domain-containing protein n=1 Tax=Panacibacter ginsenosidivorans TaxID=1813871 RepID=A0A5B8VB25_9BACT|nr:sulfotransferase domain-containing protein [Panacibacter ginsenosidivorans]QEC68562.1 sulfotransferase domain-containing protein [Panacibacter ginsenosidivorans]
MNNQLDFLVIGTQKGATTWLYECLKEHPQICLPADKKEIEYIGGKIFQEKGTDWYFSLVEHAKQNQLKGDVSVEYMWDPSSPSLVKELLPDVKLIASLRNPADRAISAYYWYLRKNLLPSDKNILETFQYLKTCYLEGRRDVQGVDIIERGMYHTQLARYTALFQPQQILVLLYEEIKEQPGKVLEQIYNFLNIDKNFVPVAINERPKQNSYSKWLVAFERIAPKSKIIAAVSNKLNQLTSSPKTKQELSPEKKAAYSLLAELFENSVIETNKIIKALPEKNQPIKSDVLNIWNKHL